MGIVFGRTGISTANGLSPEFVSLATRPSGIEIRRYPSFLVAEVKAESEKEGQEADQEMRASAFKVLAKYIGVMGSPENEAGGAISMTAPVLMDRQPESQKISMTSPVISTPGEATGTMSFIMPSKYKSLADLPKPKNDRVQLKEVPAMTVLCMTWYGRVRDGGVSKLKELVELALKDAVLKQLVKPQPEDNKWRLAGYTPPFTLPPWQKQEVHVVLPDVSEDEVKGLLEKETKDSAPAEQSQPPAAVSET